MKHEPSGARLLPANPLAAGLVAGEATADRITWIELSLIFLPLTAPISDAKVLTGRRRVARMHKIVTGRSQPIQRVSLQMILRRSLD